MADPPKIVAFEDKDMEGLSDAFRRTLNRSTRAVYEALSGGITTTNTRSKIITLNPFVGGTTELKVEWSNPGVPVGALVIAAIDRATNLAVPSVTGAFRFEPPNVVIQAVSGLTAGKLYVLRFYVFAE